METPIPPEQASFFLKLLINYILRTHVSYDKAFRNIIEKYRFPRWVKPTLYKLGYYTVNYYYTLRWLASKHGYGVSVAGVIDYFSSIGFSVKELLARAREEVDILSTSKKLSILYSYPEFIVKDLIESLSENEIAKILNSLNTRKRWLRINTLKTSIEDALKCLDETNIEYKTTKLSEYAVKVVKPIWEPIASNKCVQKALVVPQDISSIISMEALASIPRAILDACSAPGLKLSLLFMLTNNKLKALALDNSSRRIFVEAMLLKKLGVDTRKIILVNSDSSRIVFNQVFELAVVDAPCSGLGAVYSDPAVKLSVSRRSKLEYYHGIQYRILKNILRYAEKVVYITCSIHPLEGEKVIEKIIDKDLAEPIPLKHEGILDAYPGYSVSDKTNRIYPHIIDGQGFYIALLESKVVGK